MIVLERIPSPIDTYAPDFELRGIDQQVHHLARYLDKFRAIGVVFMSDRCPQMQLYLERMKNIQKSLQHQGFTLVGINPNDARQNADSSFENIKSFAIRHQINFPYLWDSTQDVTWSFGVQKTPMAFLIDQNGIIRYAGEINDNTQAPEAPKQQHLRDAAMALLQDKAIKPA